MYRQPVYWTCKRCKSHCSADFTMSHYGYCALCGHGGTWVNLLPWETFVRMCKKWKWLVMGGCVDEGAIEALSGQEYKTVQI